MKRIISMLLCLTLLASLAACGGGSGSTGTQVPGAATTEAPQAAGAFKVGYAKVDITPTTPVDLWGYAQPAGQRMSTDGYLDYIYLTCVAITDAEGNTVLMYGADLGDMEASVVEKIKPSIAKATGVSAEYMFFNATHTHSAPDCENIVPELQKAAVKAAEDAIADQKAAEMYFGTATTNAVSFVRHYFEKNGASVTDNHGNTTNPDLDRHTSEVDREMRVLQFKRDGSKDILLVNWQCHPHLTGGPQKYSISADIVGAMRTELEKEDYLVAYYQGGAGNLNPTSRFADEMINTTNDYKVTGKHLATAAKEALTSTTKLNTGAIQVTTETYRARSNKEDLDKVDEAQQVVDYFKAGHTATECKPLAESLGLYSYYHANNLLNRGARPDYVDLEISVITFGDFAWYTMPGELFDTTTKYIRDNSPYDYNFTAAYTNGYFGYFPSQEAWEYGCYESDTAPTEPGTAEGFAIRLLEMVAEHK